MNSNENIITLQNANGKNEKFQVLDVIVYNSNRYLVALPKDDPKNEGMVYMFEIEEISGNTEKENYKVVTDKKLQRKIYDIFRDNNRDTIKFED